MGGHHSHEMKAASEGGSGSSTPRGSQRGGSGSRSGSGGDLQGLDQQDKPPPSMVPVEKLAKLHLVTLPINMELWGSVKKDLKFRIVGIQASSVRKKKAAAPTCKLLVQKSQKEDGINGVTEKSFTKYLFPLYPELADHFFSYIHRAGKCKNKHIPLGTFRTHCERIMSILDDTLIIETYVKMFSKCEEGTVTPDCLKNLLYTSYKISMDHYPEGPQTCLMINKTLSSVISGCFHKKESHTVGFVVRWLQDNCHRLIFPVHRYCVHSIATRHRSIELEAAESEGSGLELGTPVLERAVGAGSALLPLSRAWLLAGTAAPLYSRPLHPPPPPQPAAGGGGLASTAWLARLVCAVPSHWVPLYSTGEHGRAANRFLHHTLAYRGPTIVLLQADDIILCVLVPCEWRESHQYWGGAGAGALQLHPQLEHLEGEGKVIYLNTHIRGYPKGLRVGIDPRSPVININEDFDSVTYRGSTYSISSIEVWGCGDQRSRETQLEIKKWQVKEAERQRNVKLSAAEWMEHPDRYLLELAGRPQYNNSAS